MVILLQILDFCPTEWFKTHTDLTILFTISSSFGIFLRILCYSLIMAAKFNGNYTRVIRLSEFSCSVGCEWKTKEEDLKKIRETTLNNELGDIMNCALVCSRRFWSLQQPIRMIRVTAWPDVGSAEKNRKDSWVGAGHTRGRLVWQRLTDVPDILDSRLSACCVLGISLEGRWIYAPNFMTPGTVINILWVKCWTISRPNTVHKNPHPCFYPAL